jgi:hypothetical protein
VANAREVDASGQSAKKSRCVALPMPHYKSHRSTANADRKQTGRDAPKDGTARPVCDLRALGLS